MGLKGANDRNMQVCVSKTWSEQGFLTPNSRTMAAGLNHLSYTFLAKFRQALGRSSASSSKPTDMVTGLLLQYASSQGILMEATSIHHSVMKR